MANEEHVARLKQGVKVWNQWREENPDISPELMRADLRSADLNFANLRGADLHRANLRSANLIDANLRDAHLHGANLSGANLSGANLYFADLRSADLRYANLRDAHLNYAHLTKANLSDAHLESAHLNYAQLEGADLTKATLQYATFRGANLCANLSGATLYDAHLTKADLMGANLSGANLSGANLSGANLSGAGLEYTNLSYANLSDANLSNVDLFVATVRSADFTGATLTGAWIKDWHINEDTKLDDVVCDYIYLKPDQQERRPSDPNQSFAPGEFTKLFQKAQETVDLLFRNGVDWQAFAYAFQQLQIENEADELAIASIENKGDGVVVIRIKATPEADRPKLHGDFMQVYEVVHKTLAAQFQARLEDKDKHINQLFVLLQASQSQNSEVTKLMTENQGTNLNFHAPVGNVAGTMQAGSKQQAIQHNYAAAPQQTLSEDLAEILALLQQLEKSNPTATAADQQAFINVAIPPTKRERILGAAQAGGLAVLEETQYGKIIKAIIEGWQKLGE